MEKVDLNTIRKMGNNAKGWIKKIYLHWSAGRYHQFYADYHINVDNDGSIYISTRDLTAILDHTWKRNTGAIGICFAGCYNACPHHGYDTDFGDYPPTQAQMDAVAQIIAVLCDALELPIDYDHVMTHYEVAEEDNYGPSTNCERWDLWYLPDLPSQEMKLGGDVLRGKALWWKQQMWQKRKQRVQGCARP